MSARQRAAEGDVVALMAYYNIANKNVAELCNHQRATPASHANARCRMPSHTAHSVPLLSVCEAHARISF